MTQLLRVARIQFINAGLTLILPVVILALALLATILIFFVIGDSVPEEGGVGGGLASVYVTMLIVHLQTMTQMFPFAVGLSVTRRVFFGATTLIIVGQSVLYGALFTLCKYIERATDGWGVNLIFFELPFLQHDNVFAQFLAYTVPMLAMTFFGLWIGIVFKRWGQYGVWAFVISLGALAVGAVVVVTWQEWWSRIGVFLTDHPPLALQAGYPLVIALVFAGAAYLTTRRAVP